MFGRQCIAINASRPAYNAMTLVTSVAGRLVPWAVVGAELTMLERAERRVSDEPPARQSAIDRTV
jgi:hypothetical protein